MVHRIALIAILALAGAARADLNLVPVASFYQSDGVRFSNLTFRDGPGLVTYVPPPQWTYTGNSARFSVYPPNTPRADASITTTRTAACIPLSLETTAHYEYVARALLPRDSTTVELHGMILNPLRICGRTTVEYIFDFVVFSQRYRLSCILLPREHDQLQFMLCAAPEQFDRLRTEFHRSLYTLEGL
jgi:hypothetical protein